MAVHTCLQDSLIGAINSPYLPTEEAHVCTWRNEAMIAATGGAQECPDPVFSRLLKTPLGFVTEHHNIQPLQS